MAIYDNRICRTCGAQFSGGPRAWYCPECRRERERIRKKRYNRGEFARHIGQKDLCENCGNEYTVESGLQKYCPDCARIMHKKLDAEQSLDYYRRNKESINPARNERRRIPEARCVICGKDFRRVGQAKTCSPECQREYENGNYNAIYGPRYRAKKKKASEE